MLRNTGFENRLKAVMEAPGNDSCAECERPRNKPEFAAFFKSPVDKKLLGVLCCKKCLELFNNVAKDEFVVKNVTLLDDWSEDDMDALELSGNNLVNACFEATVTNEKDGRDRRKYGYEAFFFEKFVNRRFFDPAKYKKLIREASQSLVLKRLAAAAAAQSMNHQAAIVVEEDLPVEKSGGGGGGDFDPDGSLHSLKSGKSSSSLKSDTISRQSQRPRKNTPDRIILLDEKEGDNNNTGSSKSSRLTKLSSARLASLKQDLLSGRSGSTTTDNHRSKSNDDTSRREEGSRRDKHMGQRSASNPRFLGGGMKRTSSRKKLTLTTTETAATATSSAGMRRASSGARLTTTTKKSSDMSRVASGSRWHSSAANLRLHGGDEDDGGRRRRRHTNRKSGATTAISPQPTTASTKMNASFTSLRLTNDDEFKDW